MTKSKRLKLTSQQKYSFCESLYASSYSHWHIRKLTNAGSKFGGGIDTKSLCGLVEKGWDLNVSLSRERALGDKVCSECRSLYLSEIEKLEKGENN